MEPIIQMRGLGKRYNINRPKGGYIALRDVLTSVARRPLAFFARKAKEAFGLAKKEDFWALREISCDIFQGEVVGIVGANGAGKSTLLKILTGITPPTEGEIVMRGRVASLLEVGTGFHPELTGRENVFLNGAILGMTKSEITRKFDEIVAFAGIEKFLDTPVKYYSSGMYVRLAFSVAAHMEPDILLVDEVLAVGDVEFQKKCLGKMEEVTKAEGRTILFVSHNLAAIQRLCKKCIFLEKGRLRMVGTTAEVLEAYADEYKSGDQQQWEGVAGDDQVRLTRTSIKSLDAENMGILHTAAPIEVCIEAEILKPVDDLIFGFSLYSGLSQRLAYTLYDDREETIAPRLQPGPFKKRFIIPANTLYQGIYKIEMDIGIHNSKRIVKDEGSLIFRVENIAGLGRRFRISDSNSPGFLRPDWSVPDGA